VSSLRQADDYSRFDTTVEMDLDPEARYWKQHSPGKWFRQAKIHGKINNEKAIILLDTGAEVSIVDTTFARKVGCYIDRSQSQECVGIGDIVYTTEGRTRIKITLGGYLVYFFDIWVADLSGQEAILGMDYMVPAGIRLDLADGTLCLPDEVLIQLSRRCPLYSDKVQSVTLDRYLQLGIGESAELPMRLRGSEHDKLWVMRGDRWVPTVIKGPGKVRYLQITNIGEKELVLRQSLQVGMWLAGDRVPRIQGYVTIGSAATWRGRTSRCRPRRTLDPRRRNPRSPPPPPGPMVERPEYPTPRAILQRQHPAQVRQVEARSKGAEDGQDGSSSDPPDRTTEGHIAGTTGIPLPQASTTAHALDSRSDELLEYVPSFDPAAEGPPNSDPSGGNSVGRGAPTTPTTVLTECRMDTVLGDEASRRVSILSPSP
ncbi:hypothetical protein PHYSODRAFT_536710, partial [Phytophthora sojae]